MAFFAEMKRRHWYKVNEENLIYMYSEYEYDVWYNNLTEEQKNRLEEYRKQKREKEEKEFNTFMMKLNVMKNICSGISEYSRHLL